MIKKIFLILLFGFVSICNGFTYREEPASYMPPPPETKTSVFLDSIQDNTLPLLLIISFLIISYLLFFLNDIVIYFISLKGNFPGKFIIKKAFTINTISYFKGLSLFLIVLFVSGGFSSVISGSLEVNYSTGDGIVARDRINSLLFGIIILCLISTMILFLFGKKKMIQNSFQISPKKGLIIAFTSSVITAGMTFVALIIFLSNLG